MAFHVHPLSLWHLLSLLFVSFCLQGDCCVQQHEGRLKLVSVLHMIFHALGS